MNQSGQKKIRHVYGNVWFGDVSDANNVPQLMQASIENILTVGHNKQNQKTIDEISYQTVDIPTQELDINFDYFYHFQHTNKFISMGNTLIQCGSEREKGALFMIAYLVQHEHFSMDKAVDILFKKNIISTNLDKYYLQKLKSYQDKVLKTYKDLQQRQNEIFSRQVNIPGWDQNKIKNQVCLILGAGGLGTVVLMQLLRLGVGKIILVDRDIVDIHNLPRQMMFGFNDVGSSKVDAAIKNSQIHNIFDTVIEGHHMDALKHWSNIVEMAKESSFVFNLIDHGDYWDLAVQSLCLQLQIPHVSGGNFANSMMIDYFPSHGKPCYLCLTPDLKNKDFVEKLHPDNILELNDISFLTPNDNPASQSYAMLCTTCGVFMANFLKVYLFEPETKQKSRRVMFYLDNIESMEFAIEKDKNCLYCADQKIPLSSIQTESTHIKTNIHNIWEDLRSLKFEKLFPNFIKQSEFEHGEDQLVGSIVKITFKDDAVWKLRIREISQPNFIISYEIIESIPQMEVASTESYIQLYPVTMRDETFIKWVTDFSSDVTANVLNDCKFKKLENLANLRNRYEITLQ